MSGDIMGRDIILLHGIFNGIAVMNKEGDAVCVTPIGANADVRTVAENHNVTRLPLFGIVRITGQNLRMTAEKGVQ